jgi:thymidylate synthase (FAD)
MEKSMSKVTLVAVTEPRIVTSKSTFPQYEPDEIMSANDFIAYCARVSNPANQNNTQTADKLLAYLVKNKHWSPFEMVSLTMEIETTRDIGRQILRHRSFSFQEFSQRYAAVVDMSEPREARLQDVKNRQNSIETDDAKLQQEWEGWQNSVKHLATEVYDWALKNGVAKEQARAVLPEGLTMSKMYMAGSLRSWIHYCELRMTQGTQKEHREIATECWKLIVKEFPALQNLFNQQ